MPADPHDLPALLTALGDMAVGSEYFDEQIARALGWTCVEGVFWTPPGMDPAEWGDDLPNWTSSLDTALTLVPMGHPFWTLRLEIVGHGSRGLSHNARITWPSYESYGNGSTPALAMCCAALRARSAG